MDISGLHMPVEAPSDQGKATWRGGKVAKSCKGECARAKATLEVFSGWTLHFFHPPSKLHEAQIARQLHKSLTLKGQGTLVPIGSVWSHPHYPGFAGVGDCGHKPCRAKHQKLLYSSSWFSFFSAWGVDQLGFSIQIGIDRTLQPKCLDAVRHALPGMAPVLSSPKGIVWLISGGDDSYSRIVMIVYDSSILYISSILLMDQSCTTCGAPKLTPKSFG